MGKVAFIQKSAYEKLSVHFLAGALREAGIEYDIFIEELEVDFYGELLKYNPSYVAYSLYIEEEDYVSEFFKNIKASLPGVITLLGGPFTLNFPDIIKKEEVDYLFRGDAEETLIEFIQIMESGGNVEKISGIRFVNKKTGQEYRNETMKLVDINNIPMPDRDLYYKYEILKTKPTKIFITSRGCPYKCTYCYNAELANFFESSYWRQRNIPDVIQEIREVKEKYCLKWVHFQDGTFNANKKWLKEFLKTYAEANLPPFLCNARVENIDEEMLGIMKKARCNRITFGIQSGNPRIRKEVAGRPMDNEKIIEACRLCKKYEIRVGVDVIFGWPGETMEEAMDTIKLCRQINVESYSSNVLVFYPGLKVTQYAYEKGFIEKIPSLSEIKQLNFNKSLMKGDIVKRLINMDKLFYYLIKFPKFEKALLLLLYLPVNRFFVLLKNVHFLFRSFKYDEKSKYKIVKEYFLSNWKGETWT